ncbi:MAG: TlpA family protein disulfide reductase [Acidimicrobiia bacterium]
MRTLMPRLTPVALILALLLAACGGDDGDGASSDSTTSSQPLLSAIPASYDLAVGAPARFSVGLVSTDKGPVGYGTVDLRFFFLGKGAANEDDTAEAGPTAVGRYLPLPGSPPPPEGADKPVFLETTERGVYSAEVAFDRDGFWGVAATADLDKPETATATFKVLPAHAVPVPGDAAILSENLTVDSAGDDLAALDSRAGGGDPVPDPELHETTVKAAIAAGRPVLLVISTPTFCVSIFCGPITDMIAELAAAHADRASFVHIEVWKDFEGKAINDAAKEWIAKGADVNEPWVFLIGPDGKITHRWDNIATRGEIEPELEKLPVIAG